MAFEPIRTERLILRPPRVEDAEAAFVRRNLPEVAKYQDWELPYTKEQAERSTAKAAAMDGPVDGEGWNLTVVDAAAPETILGDLYVELKWGGRVGYLGYTFHPDHWGRGYATEAAQALVEHFFTVLGVHRVESSLHPDNLASAKVLEACGLVVEGVTRQSFWVGDVCSDDLLFGMTRADWDAWRTRPRHLPAVVELVPLSAANRGEVARLKVHWSQERDVPSLLEQCLDLLAPPPHDGGPAVPWHRVIVADGIVVGTMTATETPRSGQVPVLQAVMIDRMHQRRGIESAALDQFERWCAALDVAATERST